MPWYKLLVNCGVIAVVCGGCQEVVDMYFHTQLGAPREPPADTNASCRASLLWAGLDFPIIIICVFKPSSTYFCDQYDHRLLYQSKHWTSSSHLLKISNFRLEISRILTKKSSSSLQHSCCSSFSALIWTSVLWRWAISCRLRRLCRFGCRRHHHNHHNH